MPSSLYKLFKGGGGGKAGNEQEKKWLGGGGDEKNRSRNNNKRRDDFEKNGTEKWNEYSSVYKNRVNEDLIKAYSNCILTLVRFVGNDCIKRYTHGTVVHTNRSAPLLSTQKDYQTPSTDIRLVGSLMGFFPEALDSLPIRDGVYKKLTESAMNQVKKKPFHENTSRSNSQVPSYLIWGNREPLARALHDLLCYLLVCSNPYDVQSSSKFLQQSAEIIIRNAESVLSRETVQNTIPVAGSISVSFDPDAASNTLLLMREMCQIYVTSKLPDEDATVRNVFGQAHRENGMRVRGDGGNTGEANDMNTFRKNYIDNLRI